MSELDSDALAQFNEAFAPSAAPEDTGPPAEPDPVPSEPEATTEPDPPVDDKPAKPDPDERMAAYLAKYGGDPDKAYEASVEAQSTIGSLKRELGELRSMLSERLDRQPEPQLPSSLDDMDDRQLGVYAQNLAVHAFQSGVDPESSPAFEAVMDAWYLENPRAASRFERTIDRVRFQAELEQTTGPVRQTLQEQQHRDAVQQFRRQTPDFDDYIEDIQQLAVTNEILGKALTGDDPNARVQALGVLYQLAKSAAPGRATPPASTTADDVERAVQQAAVISTANTNQGTPPAKDYVDDMFDRWQNLGIEHLR